MGWDVVVVKLFQVSRDTVQRNRGKNNCGKAKELWQGKGTVAKEL